MNSVPIDMPATTTTPIEKRLAAPAPAAVTSGTKPTTIAAVVIRMGRRRTRAARVRLRPILMTTAAMVVGLVPLVTATGAGAASRFSIGVVVVAGMSIGTLFTLFVLPAVYTVLAKDHAAASHSVRARELAQIT